MTGIERGRRRAQPRSPGMVALWVVLGMVATFVGIMILPFLGVVAALLLVVLVMLGVFVGPWAVLGLGIFGFVRLVQEGRRRRVARPVYAQPLPPRPRPAPVPAPAAPLRSPLADLPPAVRAQVERIRLKARSLLDRPRESRLAPEDAHLVEHTLRDYLPHAIDAYLALPPGSADWPVAADGRTGVQVLTSQLQILERGLDAAAGRVWRNGAQRLMAHQRFLEERFGKRDEALGELELPRHQSGS
jgi:hypothetical protein